MNINDFDIRKYLDSLSVPYWEHGMNVSKGWIGTQCLYCDDSHNHMGVHLYRKNFSCWKCGAKGSLTDLICDLENVSYHIALQRIEEFQSNTPQQPKERQPLEDDGQNILPFGWSPTLTKTQKMWIRGRRYDPNIIQKQWGIVAGPPTGRWGHRIICPVLLRSRTRSWVGIDASGTKSARYKASSVEESLTPTSELPYGINNLNGGTVLIVEGILDVWRMGRGAIATLGTGISDRKIETLAALKINRYFIMFDSETQAIKKANSLGNTLRHMTRREVNILELDKGDPDDLDDKTASDIRKDIGLN